MEKKGEDKPEGIKNLKGGADGGSFISLQEKQEKFYFLERIKYFLEVSKKKKKVK